MFTPALGVQRALQAAEPLNLAVIGDFRTLSVGDNNVWFLDAVNFVDPEG